MFVFVHMPVSVWCAFHKNKQTGLALTTLCILTMDGENVPAMIRRGLVGALVTASKSHRLAECATIGLNNLSEYNGGSLVGKLIQGGAVNILIDHIANQDPRIRGFSVLAVCHLACACADPEQVGLPTAVYAHWYASLEGQKSSDQTQVVKIKAPGLDPPELGDYCLKMMVEHGAIEALLLAGFVRASADSNHTQEVRRTHKNTYLYSGAVSCPVSPHKFSIVFFFFATNQACCKGLYALLSSCARRNDWESLCTWQVVRARYDNWLQFDPPATPPLFPVPVPNTLFHQHLTQLLPFFLVFSLPPPSSFVAHLA